MSVLIDKARFAGHMHDSILCAVRENESDVDGMRLLQVLAGILTETLLLFDNPDQGLIASITKLEQNMSCEAYAGGLTDDSLPPAYMIDTNTELGRGVARKLFEEWLDCAHEFHDLALFVIQNVMVEMEGNGQNRSLMLGLFHTLAIRALSYEIAAQELCDIVIEEKIGTEGWSFAESVTGLSAVAGRCLGLSRTLFSPPGNLDHVGYVMTQEAIRSGIPAGSDWRFGLAANDAEVSAPFDLIFSLWPRCREFFHMIEMHDLVDQAVACAKAAGRMLAVAAGGDMPEIEPVIAKPLAMMALTETYITVCRDEPARAAETVEAF